MKEPKWYEHLYWSIRYGKWSCGFASKKEWAEKERLSLSVMYYDGWHWALHIGGFYVSASYY